MKKAAEARPGKGRVSIKPIDSPDQSPILNPSAGKEKPQHGIIVAIGKRNEEEADFNLGDNVVYGRYAGVEIIYADGPHIVMMESDILSTI